GWGSTGLVVAPSGKVMPCHAADSIPHLEFQNVRDAHLGEIWREGPAFMAYRGVEWMAEPCRSCERRDVDFGGCRCQAMALAGDAAATDPVCRKSPKRHVVDALLAEEVGAEEAFVYRR
ncbi:MAG: SPASM domain-containing protein, partial [Pseudomonadota bacterium]